MAQVPTTRMTRGRGGMPARRDNPLERLRQDFDALFGRLWGGWPTVFEAAPELVRVWDFDVIDRDKEIVVRAEMPGFQEDDIDVQLSNDVLTIRAEQAERREGEEELRSFTRTVILPSGLATDKAFATYQNGVLELHIPKAETAQPKRIQVQGQTGSGQQRLKGTPAQQGQEGSTAPTEQQGSTNP